MSRPTNQRPARKFPARQAPFAHSRSTTSADEWQREMLELWLYTSLKMHQFAGAPDIGPPERVRRRRNPRRQII